MGHLINDSSGDAAAIINTITAMDGGDLVELPNGEKAALLPQGKALTSIKKLIDEYRDRPERIEAIAELTTADSFIDYMNRFKRTESAVFVGGDAARPSMLGMVDFHGIGSAAEPSFCKHSARYHFPLSDAMEAWVEATNGGLMDQAEFASFLQDREYDIENPPLDWMMMAPADLSLVLDLLNLHDDKGDIDDGADDNEADEDSDEDRYIPRSAVYKLRKIRFGNIQKLIALSRGIEIAIGQKATAAFNPKTGERVVHFSEQHDTRDGAGRKVIVPEAFFINIPVFQEGERHLLPVRLFYRQKAGQPMWGVELIDAPRLIRLAVKAVAESVAAETGLPVFSGKP